MATQTFTRPGPRGQAMIERDSAVNTGALVDRYPFVIERGQGTRVWDIDGNEYIDFAAGIAVTSTGHSHPKVVQAISEQAQKFIHIAGTDYYYDVQTRVMEKLAAIAPFQEDARVFLTNSGTEAIEGAVKMAKWHTKRQNVVAFLGSFHGRTMGALSLTSSKIPQRENFFPLVPGVYHAPYNNPYRCMHGREEAACRDHCTCVSYIRDILFKRIIPPESVAAIVFEPIQGEGGYVVPDQRFVQEIRQMCNDYGIMMIVDEIQSGAGRTGKWWAIEHFGVEPDIVCSAKGIASGMPLGAVISRASVADWGAGSHGSTYAGNPVACAASLATLDLLENGFMANATVQGEYIKENLQEMQSHHPLMQHGRVDGIGLMVGAELVLDAKRTPVKELRNQVERQAIDNGLLILGAGESTLRFCPALMIDRGDVDEGLKLFDKTLTQVEQAAGLTM